MWNRKIIQIYKQCPSYERREPSCVSPLKYGEDVKMDEHERNKLIFRPMMEKVRGRDRFLWQYPPDTCPFILEHEMLTQETV